MTYSCSPSSCACSRTVSSSGASYTQKVPAMPLSSTTTWLCSQTIPSRPRPTCFDFLPIRGISVSVTLNFRTIKYLGIHSLPVDPSRNDTALVAGNRVVDQPDGGGAEGEHDREREQRPAPDVVLARELAFLGVHRTSTAITTKSSARYRSE